MNINRFVAALVAATVIASLGGVSAQADTPREASERAAVAPSAAAYTVKPGVVFNNPRRQDQAYRVIDQIKRTIDHAPKGARIWIMSWNFNAGGIVDALIRAHNRGVGVRVIMAREIANKQGSGGPFWRLTRALRTKNAGRPARRKSFTRTCSNSCRGRGGSMHSKLMLVSKSGESDNIVQQGSANLTQTAATNQWTDWYTVPNNKTVFDTYSRMYTQALKDQPAPAISENWKHIYSWFSPRTGANDPVMSMLNDVTCTGADGGAGTDGKTTIRVASAVFQNDRGLKIADKLKALQGKGCNVRVVFTMMTNKIRNAIRGVPTRQLVYDWDGDGAFDRYLHMKAMTISGNFRGDSSARVLFNGSANWSTMGMISDEQGWVIKSDSREKEYESWINGLFNSAPRGLRPTPEYYDNNNLRNPYEGLELDGAI